MTTNYFMVQTANGWVGRRTLWSELSDDMAKGFAYCFPTEQEAQYVADRFNGAVVAK